MTNDEDSLVLFEPIQFFPTVVPVQRDETYEEESLMWGSLDENKNMLYIFFFTAILSNHRIQTCTQA